MLVTSWQSDSKLLAPLIHILTCTVVQGGTSALFDEVEKRFGISVPPETQETLAAAAKQAATDAMSGDISAGGLENLDFSDLEASMLTQA